ncbi:MAG: small, acid-soluble spore protein, alpha/beta type [Clostridiales bacterium]|nr:small, acid-soluble spore protein, alpha/beta type [Clostridiales bacterium]
MGKKDELLSGALRRNAITYLTKAERQKYEIARELGLLDRVREVGWAGLSTKETGRIGGLIGQKNRKAPS